MDRNSFRPQRQALALEQRIMFDGAAAVAVDQHQVDAAQNPATTGHAQPDHAPATEVAALAAAPVADTPAASAPAPHALLVIDSRVEQRDVLTAQVAPGTTVLVVNTDQDGVAAISAALKDLGQVDSIQILSHGAAGQFTLGNRTVSSDNVDQLGTTLQGWRTSLAAGADIQLYGCDVGAGASGQLLVNELAQWTGADVAASNDATGSAAAGGDWLLETQVGTIDKSIALGDAALAGYAGLLADASPTVTLSSGGDDALLGGDFTFTASFSNPSTQVGFAPYIDLFIPVTGKDGAGAEVDDGVTFVSATFQGVEIKSYEVVFDANGQAVHPLAKDANGQPLVINAADFGLRAGDAMRVLQLPNASITSGQPAIDIVITMHLSDLADTSLTDGAPQLTIKARGGFQFGNTSADDPTVDPTLIEAGAHDFVVNPTMVDLTQTANVPDGQTVTGPNYERSITVTASTAPGQSLDNVVVEQDLPNDIIVKGIVPGANGTVTSITLQDGTVITDAGTIASTLTAGAYLQHYEVTYATLSGSVDTTVNFYVPEVDANGSPVLDPTTGAPRTITIAEPEASAQWTPKDTRDVPADGAVLSGSGDPVTFTVLPLVVYKEAAVTTDPGGNGASPGDTVTYSLEVDISDYFAFGRNVLNQGSLVIVDQATDGQTLVPGSGVLSVTINGQRVDMVITPTVVVNADGSSTLTLDIAQTLRDNGQALAALVGDLAFDTTLDGRTTAVISYQMVISDQFSGGDPSQSAINEGDTIGNDATISGTVLVDRANIGGTATDGDSTTITIPTNQVDIVVLTVDGTDVTADPSVELRPGDVVTFQISYDLVTGDYQQFSLSAYLPLPLFDVNGVTWTEGGGINQWVYGPNHTITDTVGSVTSVVNGNYIVFDFGDHSAPFRDGSRVELRFTMVVGDQPFGDQRNVTVIAQSDQVTTNGQDHLISQDAALIDSIAEPVLTISHGVVSSSNGTVTGAGPNGWTLPGDNTNPPFTAPITDIASVNGNVAGIDGGDTLRLATAIENSGGGGAYDVSTQVNLPAGLGFVNGSLAGTLRVFRGDGTQLVEGTDYTVTGNVVTFLDPTPGSASLLPGRAGTPQDASGENVVVLVYDVQVANDIAASSTLESTAVLTNYAAVNDGEDFTPVDLSDVAGQQVLAPTVTKVFADGALDDGDSSATHTSGANLVIGETMDYDIVVTLPEGTTSSLRIDDLIPPGLALDMSFGGGVGYEIITTVAGSGALAADFGGTLSGGTASGIGGTAGQDGVDARMTFTASVNNADNVTGNNSFVIRVRLVASNTTDNQAGRVLSNSAQIVYVDPDGDVAGGTAVDRTVGLQGAAPAVTVVEPTLTLTQTPAYTSPLGVDEGDTVTYTIVLANNSGVDAFDISFQEIFPTNGNVPTALLQGVTLTGVVFAGGATGQPTDFVLGADGILRTVNGANIDIANGGSITLTVAGIVTADAVNQQTIDSTADLRWTSLNDTVPVTAAGGERTGTDGLINSGALNDYRADLTTRVPTESGVQLSRIGGLDATPPADGGTDGPNEQVAVGEIVRYRVVSAIAEGDTTNYQVQVTLDGGLTFQNDGTIKIAIVSNGGVTSTLVLNADGTLNVAGDRSNPIAQPITTDLSGAAPDATINPTIVSVDVVDGRTVITFSLGDIRNNEGDDNLEGVVIEFNARVANVDTNTAGTALGVTAAFVRADGAGATDSVTETVVEPAFGNMVKQVESFTPNASGTTSTANVSVGFTQTGSATAYDVRLDDSFTGVDSYTLASVTIIDANGVSRTVLPADFAAEGITNNSDATGIHLAVDSVAAGTRVVVNYSVTVDANTAYATTDAVLTWSSLPESFTNWGGTTLGTDASPDGERDGSGGATPPNTYVLREGAGLGLVNGTLWDDSLAANGAIDPGELRLAGQTVTLTWAGADGAFGTGDDGTFTTTTDANGFYRFSALAAGNYRVDAPTPITVTDPNPGPIRVRFDSDAATLGQVASVIGEGSTGAADFGYVQINDAPVNTVPGQQSGQEDVLLNIAPISVADVDLNNGPAPGVLDVTLTVANGVLNFTATPALTMTVNGAGTATLTLSGTAAEINAVLATLTYRGNPNYNGNDTLTITTRDRGSFGDADGDGTPAEPVEDQLQDVDTVAIVLAPVNDVPIGVNDTAIAVEAGGTNNGTAGVNPSGNLLANDTDVDIATNGDVLHLTSVTSILGTTITFANGDDSSTEQAIAGSFGTLYVRANGATRYVVDNANPLVQSLRTADQTLTETFTYTLADAANASAAASPTLTITIQGANDTPVANDDAGAAVEAGGVANGTPGSPAIGNVLTNDTDVDSTGNGETRTVTGIRNVAADAAGPLNPVAAGTSIVSQFGYGTLVINPDGSYTYTVDNNNAAVNALPAGQTLQDVFSYQVTDAGGLSALATLTITITGADDAPVAVDDVATAVEAGGIANGTVGLDPAGSVFGANNDGDPDTGETATLTVTGVRTGAEAGTGTAGTVGTALVGTYGTLTLNADGTYTYVVDNANGAVQALRLAGNTLTEQFTYTVADRPTGGLTDTATLTITIQGANDNPVAQNDVGTAVEAGGVNNGTPGSPATGNVLANDTDVDQNGETKAVQGFVQGANAGTPGTAFTAQYGTLTLNADGSYSYVVDDANAAVQALLPGQTLTEVFTYTVVDALGATSTATLTITIQGADDAPTAADDAGGAVEAGGIANGTAGSDATGNVLTNDGDIDNPGIVLRVSDVRTGAEAGTGTAGTVGTGLVGAYGTLTLNANGTYTYVVDNNNAAVQALRLAGDTLTDQFTYTVSDPGGQTDTATLTITIAGANDNPVASNDAGTAIEAGGVGNGTPGAPAAGNVLANDTDVDQNGETKAVQGFVQGANAGTPGTAFTAQYGTLTLNADGSYTYVVNDDNPTVQALLPAQTLTEVFTYTVVDALGATSTATLTITIQGADDAPTAADDTGNAVEAGGIANGTAGSDATGDVLTNDGDIDTPGIVLRVSDVRTGAEAGTGNAGAVGTALAGAYGTLTLNANGSYTYVVDNSNAAVQALRLAGNTLADQFTYTVTDPRGLTDTATLTITIQGANDNPVASNDAGTAIEAGGVGNGTPGSPATGNVLANDTDVDQNGETQAVQGFVQGANTGTPGTAFTAQYGTLTLNADGSYTYVVDDANLTVQALLPGQTLTETFAYTMIDALGATSTATLTITIQGRDDTPVAVDDTAAAMEAGGTANATPGVNPSGNVLVNDTDVDNLDPRRVDGIRTGAETDGGSFTAVGALQPATIVGRFGTLTVRADGSYDYAVDNNAVLVERMRGGNQDSLTDTFSYRAVDLAGQFDVAQLVVTIDGAWDAPVAVDDANIAAAGTVRNPGQGVDAVGNVLPNDTDVDVPDGKTVTGIGAGAEASAPALSAVGATFQIDGLYGTLTINADGSYVYAVDTLNLAVQRLQPGETLDEFFTYEVTDNGSLTDRAQLHIVVRGINNPPFTLPDIAQAVEAGGLDNATPGVDPTGNVLRNDIDLDRDALTVTGIRTGPVLGTGTDGALDQVLRGQWGDLVIHADGSYTYIVDNTLAQVQALRISGQTLQDDFTYTVADTLGDTNTGLLRIVIDGRNDTPVAQDDTGVAVEAGGIRNGTPGSDATGNVLDNDNDVDGVAQGETEQVARYTSATGAQGEAGSAVAGLYGQLVINADGSYRYVVDNDNPVVQAMRTSGQTLTETFSYVMRDTAGATSQANLLIVVRGADDNPVAVNDSNVAQDQVPAPQATGNVLPNDSDVDGGDSLHVGAIRTGAEAGSGTAGALGQPLAGRYGTLVIHADGSYSYTIDMTNPEVLANAGAGRVLHDVFTYTLVDIAGATDLAELVIDLDIAAPYIPPGPHFLGPDASDYPAPPLLGFEPGLFVQPVVRADALLNDLSRTRTDGSDASLLYDWGIRSVTLTGELGAQGEQFVHRAVAESQREAQLALAQFLTRQGRISLSADGLLPDPSVFADGPDLLTVGESQRPAAADGQGQGSASGRSEERGDRAERGERDNNTAGRPDNRTGLEGDVPAAPAAQTATAFTQQLKVASSRLSPFVHQ